VFHRTALRCRFNTWGSWMVSDEKIVPFSGDRRKRVLDAKSGNLLAWVQIFREETCRAAFDGGGDNERIPEAYPRFVFGTECHRKLGRVVSMHQLE